MTITHLTVMHSTQHALSINPGETIADLFTGLGLNAQQLNQMLAFKDAGKLFTDLIPGHESRLQITTNGQLLQFIYPIDNKIITITPQTGLIQETNQDAIPTAGLQRRLVHVHSTLEHSLTADTKNSGLPHKTLLEMSNILSWQINFSKDLRAGDQFNVIYPEYYYNGKKLHSGHILAAELITPQGKTYSAIRYANPNTKAHYYSFDGTGLQQAFLRYPLHFNYISSTFAAHGRYHPILHLFRPHLGVDLAAPAGTPVHAVGDGTILFIGQDAGYGKAVIIDHGRGYSTLYAHLSHFPHGEHIGNSVKEGQIIGYVGQTGLATGPHLHYEFRINGLHYDPSKVTLPADHRLTGKDKTEFMKEEHLLLSLLQNTSKAREVINMPSNPVFTHLAENERNALGIS